MIRSGNTSVLNINYCKFIQTMRPLNKVSTTVTYDKSYKLQNTRAEQCNELKRFSYTHLSYVTLELQPASSDIVNYQSEHFI